MVEYGGADASPDTQASPGAAVLATADDDLSGGGCSDPPSNLERAIDLLERQQCNCVKKIQCLRCELLALLT